MKQCIKFLKFLWVILIIPSLYGMENLAPNNNKRPYSFSEVQKENQEPNLKKAKIDKKYGVAVDLDKYPNFIKSIEQALGVNDPNLQKEAISFFIKAVEQALGIDNLVSTEDALDMIGESFDAFEIRREKNESKRTKLGGKNILFYKGDAYLNGLIPINYAYDNLWINSKRRSPYKVIQLCDILEYGDRKKELEAIGRIAYCFPLLQEVLTWNTIREFWYDIRGKGNRQIDSMFEKHMGKSENWPSKDPNFDMYLIAVADYVKSLNKLGIYTRNLKFNEKGLSESFYKVENKTENLMKGFLKKFGEYVKELDENDGNNFLKYLKNSKNFLEDIQELYYGSEEDSLSYYKKYTHTERMTQYLRKRDGILSEPFYAISYKDPCTDSDPQIDHCEQMFAKTTPEEPIRKRKNSDENDITIETEKHYRPNAIIISGYPYGSRNSGVRQARENSDLVNHSVWLYQLSPKSSQKN